MLIFFWLKKRRPNIIDPEVAAINYQAFEDQQNELLCQFGLFEPLPEVQELLEPLVNLNYIDPVRCKLLFLAQFKRYVFFII